MSDWQSILFAALAVAGLAYCLWKTQQDWERSVLGWRVWGTAASLSAFIVVALLFAKSVLRNLLLRRDECPLSTQSGHSPVPAFHRLRRCALGEALSSANDQNIIIDRRGPAGRR